MSYVVLKWHAVKLSIKFIITQIKAKGDPPIQQLHKSITQLPEHSKLSGDEYFAQQTRAALT